MDNPAPIAIVGPTAVGKSTLADALACALGGEVVSADSMQVYRGMDIGTAKTPVAQRHAPLRCIDLVEPGEPYSAALYQRDARVVIDGLLSRGAVPVVAGGTGLYVRAALDEFAFPQGELSSPLRAQLEARAAVVGPLAMHAELTQIDPAAAEHIHPNNVRRTIRAIEMAYEGRSYAQQAAGFTERTSHYPGCRYIGLAMDRAALYARIDARVHAMVADGLPAEVERLLDAGYRSALTATQAIGYKELVPVIEGDAPIADAVTAIQQATRRYAKRQLTWFRADPRVQWIDVTGLSPESVRDSALRLLESSA